jgi:hypothetical protein
VKADEPTINGSAPNANDKAVSRHLGTACLFGGKSCEQARRVNQPNEERAAEHRFRWSLRSVDLLSAGIFLFIVVIGAATIRRLRLSYSLYLWGTLGLILMRYNASFQLQSLSRYALSMFPLFIALALVLDSPTPVTRVARIGYVIIGCTSQIVLLILFVHWRFVA